jgi:hypothetical protein
VALKRYPFCAGRSVKVARKAPTFIALSEMDRNEGRTEVSANTAVARLYDFLSASPRLHFLCGAKARHCAGKIELHISDTLGQKEAFWRRSRPPVGCLVRHGRTGGRRSVRATGLNRTTWVGEDSKAGQKDPRVHTLRRELFRVLVILAFDYPKRSHANMVLIFSFTPHYP